MYGQDILCGILKGTFKILRKISYAARGATGDPTRA